jgi:PKD repeat protein
VDIAAHEITHGLTEFNAGLIYQDESGALNEGYSDIFGTAIEFYAKPSSANWTMGEDLGSPFRSLQNPNAHGDPDTYFGTNWYTGTGDNGGVHTNSQVIGYWYYLLTVGGSGTNDIGNAFNVTGIGMDAASQISFRTLCTYLPVDATYEDARFFSVLSAIDIYGPCTPEVAAVTNAMYAVGLGVPYVPSVIADFSSDLTSACSAPFAVNFQNLSNNSTSFLWNFGDGTTSTLVSPTHTYTSLGNFNVSLVANGGSCGMDTTIKNSFVSISEANPCIVIMPTSGSGITQTACAGTLFDGGGPSGNYIDNADAVITISPTGATQVTIEFVLFDVEPGSGATCDYDYLEIFDGPNTSAASLGRFCNTNGSPGIINSSGGSLTIQLHSDQGLNLAGFEANWSCSLANNPPVANFTSAPASTCTGDVSFTDNSTNGPTSWMWDFGDGQTSTLQNPTHNYSANGTYNVSLTATNGFGSDNITFNNLVTVNRPLSPVVVNDTICQNEQAVLNATGNGDLNWYSASTGGTLIFSGTTFTTPSLSASATYYVENAVIASSQFVGDLRSSTVGGFFTSNVSHYLVFDCLSPCELVSVEVNAGAAGTRVIQLKNSSGTIMDAVSVNIPAGVSRINLNFSIPVGNNFQLVGPVSPNLWRNNASCTYPYQISGLISIKTSSAGTNPTNYYYYFYDWEVKEPDCISPRVPVNAEVQICQGIENDLLAGVKSFPNPVNKILSIELPVELDFKNILMKDILGNNLNTVFSLKSDNIIEVDLSSMSDGVYLIAIETNKGLMFQKIIKK